MQLMKCPKQEALFEYVSIRNELGLFERARIRIHSYSCKHCQEKMAAIRKTWEAYYSPEPDITSSLIRVYSRLQKDETLILKGWKLGELRSHKDWHHRLFAEGWLFRGTVAAGATALITVILMTSLKAGKDGEVAKTPSNVPYAQIRFEDKNRVKVQYVRPELLQSIEFETTGSR